MPGTDASLPVKNLSALLRQKFQDDFTIVHVDWKNLTDPGENYGSLIIAVNAKLRIKEKEEVHNLVIKLPPPSKWLQELFNSPITFVKELQFYRDLTPIFLEFQRENGIKEPEKTWLGADYYAGRVGLEETDKFDDQAAIILQNLNYSGYRTFDRLAGLNLKQTEFAVRKLAKLHAIPIAMKKKRPEIFEKNVLPTLSQPANETAKLCLIDMTKRSMNDLSSMPKTRDYLPKVERTMNWIDEIQNSGKKSPLDHWATVVHNDFWVNNMMFKVDDKDDVIDMKIVDFQLYVHDYGVNDLIFFLISSPTKEVMERDFDRLIDLYYESFVDTLLSLSIKVDDYRKSELLQHLNNCATLKFTQCLMMNQVIKSKPGAAPKMEDIDSKETFLGIEGGDVYHAKMLHTVEFFDKRGWLK